MGGNEISPNIVRLCDPLLSSLWYTSVSACMSRIVVIDARKSGV
jgi:hypothetical protein